MYMPLFEDFLNFVTKTNNFRPFCGRNVTFFVDLIHTLSPSILVPFKVPTRLFFLSSEAVVKNIFTTDISNYPEISDSSPCFFC